MFEKLPPLSPALFVQMGWQCPYLKGPFKTDRTRRLPDPLGEPTFATLHVGWNEEGLTFHIDSASELTSVELFLDTRDLKTKGQISRFCHHFLFPLEGTARELTRFRGEDHHRLADPEDLKFKIEKGWRGVDLTIPLPAALLHGFDPHAFPRIGFAYRIRTPDNQAQHFPLSSQDVSLEQHPAAWSTLHLKS